MSGIFERLLESLNNGHRAAVVTEYNASGAVSRSLVDEDDREAWTVLDRGEEGLSLVSCGDSLVMTEFYSPRPRLVIFGGGHIALPLSSIGASLGFRVLVYDDRPSFANETRFPDAETVVCDSFDNAAKRAIINQNDYVVIVTRGHRHDSLCLRGVLEGAQPRYMGMIGSRRRVAIVKKQMEEETGETKKLAMLHAPIGLAIGAVTPAEIAVSILSEIIKEMRLGPPDTDGSVLPKPQEFINPDMELLAWLAGVRSDRAALATVVKTDGSTPRETGAKMAVLPHGQTVGSIGGGCSEAEVTRKAIDIIRNGGHYLMDVDLTDTAEEDGMVCGGVMTVLLEPV